MQRTIPLFTTEGVKDARITNHPFSTRDKLGLELTRFHRAPSEDVVVIIHGLTTSTDMYIMPEHRNLVSFLLDSGWTDVFCLDFRMSNRFPYNLQRHRYTHDDVALFDHPAALDVVRELTGGKRIHVICHCLGSVSFMMSLFGKASRGISSTIANSVALTPRVPSWSRFKLTVMPFVVDYILQFPYLDPNWSVTPGLTLGKFFSKIVTLFHRECDVPQCHMLSVMWGTGWPALYSHRNLHDVTHERGGDLYGGTSMHFYRHVKKMVKAKGAVKYDPSNPALDELPNDYFQYAESITTPVLLMTGRDNFVFADSNIECHRRLEAVVPGRHELHVFDGYGHQDVFMGKNNHEDIFPRLLQFLEKHRGRNPEDDLIATPVHRLSPGIGFSETMKGSFTMGATDPERAADSSEAKQLTMNATIAIDDLERFLANPDHEGSLRGHLSFAPLGDHIASTGGVFNLFQKADARLKLMVYTMSFEVEGKRYLLAGKKHIRDDAGFDLWDDTTTLFTRLHEGDNEEAPVVGAGILRLGVKELFAMLGTLEPTNTEGFAEKLRVKARFGRFFLGELWDTYGFGGTR